MDYYKKILNDLISKKILDKKMKILVLCGDKYDKQIFESCHFSNVVISNINDQIEKNTFTPFKWSYQDAENLTFEDNSFDFCIVHSGLHHCYSPHRALLEMYRVSRKGCLLFEPYDNLLTRLGVLFHIGQEYELASVFFNNCSSGGVKNTTIPNYVYRWTEKEIIKTIKSFALYGKNNFNFFYMMRIPWHQLKGKKNKLIYYAVLLSFPFLKTFSFVFPKQSNNFAALVLKPKITNDLYPWLLCENGDIKINRSWLESRYK